MPLIKVAPKPATSIPRLELCATVEATRAARKIANELDVPLKRTPFNTDSKIVLGFLTNTKESFQRYVTIANLLIDRLKAIPPFANTGVDVFGPFLVHGDKKRGAWRPPRKSGY